MGIVRVRNPSPFNDQANAKLVKPSGVKADMEDILMITPFFFSAMILPKIWVGSNAPKKLRLKTF